MAHVTRQPIYGSRIIRCVTVPGVAVDICKFEFATPGELAFFDDHHVFGLSLSPQPRNSVGRFAASDMDFVPSGDVTFKPAGVTVYARNDGGPQTILRCRLSEERFRAIAGRDVAWGNRELVASMNVDVQDIRYLLGRLAQELERPGYASRSFIESTASLLVIDLMRSMSFGQSPIYRKGGLTPLQISWIEGCVSDEDRPVPTVGELAVRVGLSERHLLRAFRETYGTTLRDHLQDIMVTRARAWLARNDMPIKQIAARLGFSSQASFTTAFGRCTSETPLAFRRRSAG